jgi:hypothetical protein
VGYAACVKLISASHASKKRLAAGGLVPPREEA